ncbi:hypothetical protein AXF42_Ash008150 [Apostasia shenzhenica]|uniref:Pre-rRNA-processing protein TSR2 like n=1 Tax=Apostasia shenzhenica TaxID=1088818 RepID=A0A2I0A8P9_9ASPA|nr:hypothetical protein AXF42_Ash008150 [Apostasia shenzhenica]
MDSSNEGSNRNPFQVLSGEAISLLEEGISLVLSRWTALQMAVENEWGGRDSRRKYDELASSIFSWFIQTKEPRYIDDLENILDESMVGSFNTEIEDGSIEEVSEQLMITHEDLLQGNFQSIENLRKSNFGMNAVSQSRQAMNNHVDNSSDEEGLDMIVDETHTTPLIAETPNPAQMPDEEGWSVVGPRRGRPQKSG